MKDRSLEVAKLIAGDEHRRPDMRELARAIVGLNERLARIERLEKEKLAKR